MRRSFSRKSRFEAPGDGSRKLGMSPKIHFGVCGIGYGHAARSTILIEEFLRRGWIVSVSSYGDGLRYFKRAGIGAKPAPGISYGVLPEGKVSIKLTIYKNILLPIRFAEQVSRELSFSEDASLVVSDSRASTVLAGKILGKPVLTILNQFNIRVEYPKYKRLIELVEAVAQAPGEIWALSDEILIADYPPPYTISKQNLAIPESLAEKTSFIGPIMERVEGSAPRKIVCEKYGLDPEAAPIILYHASGPSYERRRLTSLLLPILDKLSGKFQFVATLGGDRPNRSYESLKVFSWVENPVELLGVADAVICRAGQTTLAKALAAGKPVIMIPIPAHGEQLGNALSVSKQGAGLALDQEKLSAETLERAIRRILSDPSFSEKAGEYRDLARKLDPVEYVCSKASERASA